MEKGILSMWVLNRIFIFFSVIVMLLKMRFRFYVNVCKWNQFVKNIIECNSLTPSSVTLTIMVNCYILVKIISEALVTVSLNYGILVVI